MLMAKWLLELSNFCSSCQRASRASLNSLSHFDMGSLFYFIKFSGYCKGGVSPARTTFAIWESNFVEIFSTNLRVGKWPVYLYTSPLWICFWETLSESRWIFMRTKLLVLKTYGFLPKSTQFFILIVICPKYAHAVLAFLCHFVRI